MDQGLVFIASQFEDVKHSSRWIECNCAHAVLCSRPGLEQNLADVHYSVWLRVVGFGESFGDGGEVSGVIEQYLSGEAR